jgi:hypothetical protein
MLDLTDILLKKTTINKGNGYRTFEECERIIRKTTYHQKREENADLIFYASFLKFRSETEF